MNIKLKQKFQHKTSKNTIRVEAQLSDSAYRVCDVQKSGSRYVPDPNTTRVIVGATLKRHYQPM